MNTMCYNCGCNMTFDDMGNPDNITDDTFERLANSKGKDVEEIMEIVYLSLKRELEGKGYKEEDPEIAAMFEKAAKAWGQSIEDAKKQTFKLLSRSFQD